MKTATLYLYNHRGVLWTMLALVTFVAVFTGCSALAPEDLEMVAASVGVVGTTAGAVATGTGGVGAAGVATIATTVSTLTAIVQNMLLRRAERIRAERGEHPLQLAGVNTPPTTGGES